MSPERHELCRRSFTLVTDFGEAEAPADLVTLYDEAPKVTVVRRCEYSGEPYSVSIPDIRTALGKAFYEREADALKDATERAKALYMAGAL